MLYIQLPVFYDCFTDLFFISVTRKLLSFHECEFSRERRPKFGEFRFYFFFLHDTVYQQCNLSVLLVFVCCLINHLRAEEMSC